MKKILFILLSLLSVQLSAQQCGFDILHQQMMNTDSEYAARVNAMNRDIANILTSHSLSTYSGTVGTIYEIPVVVHVVHTGGALGTAYNPADSTIENAMAFLNEAYAATYSGYVDTSNGGVYFPVKFVLAKRDMNCNGVTGINRVDGSGNSAYVSYGVNLSNTNGVGSTFLKASTGWDNKSYYNIWVVNKIDGQDGTSGSFVGGFTTMPGADRFNDGAIILASQFYAGSVSIPHEVGHGFGLYHTFQGDGTGSTCPTNTNCDTDGDHVCDTEPHKRGVTSICQSGTNNSCVGATFDDRVAKNIMNYGGCPDRFTEGQMERFIAILKAYRPGLISSMAGVDTAFSVVAANCTTTTTNKYGTYEMGPIYVKLNDLENSSSGTDDDAYGYYDYSCRLRANLVQGKSYTIQLATFKNPQNIAAYIDYNNDGVFVSGEQVASFTPVTYGSATDTDWHSTTISIPTSGVTTCTGLRMRVISVFANNSFPANLCGTLQYGQVEDYAVIIRPSSADASPTISNNPVCSGGGNAVFKVNTSGTLSGLSYEWYKNNSVVGANSNKLSLTGLSNGDYIQCKVNYTDACSIDSAFTDKLTITTQTDTNAWVGINSTSYNTGSNWSCGSKPTASQTAIIDGELKVNAVGTVTVPVLMKNLWVKDGATFRVDTLLEVRGDINMDDNTTLNLANAKLLLNGTTAQSLNLGVTTHRYVDVDTMELDNSAGASFGFGVINIKSEYQPTSGMLVSNNRLRTASDSTGTGRIAQGSSSGGYIMGNILARLYIPGGRRAFRFISHCAIDSKQLSGLQGIDITGAGGSANGFTTTASNNPSAFYFDVDSADNSTTGNNPGWQAYTSATTYSWSKGRVTRILVRGKSGEGLNGGSYTPSAATLGMYEVPNQGDQTVTLSKGANTNFVLVGNPFPSQVQLNTVARGSSVGSNFYIWDPNQGVKGGYTSHMFSSSYVLPQWGAFVTTVSANTNNTMVFEEADKTGSTPAAQFKGTGNNYVLELAIDDTSYHWDRLLISFDQAGYAVEDKLDAVKLNNPGLDFYTMSHDSTDLSIDVRPMQDKDVIPVGVDVWEYGGSGTFTITAKQLNLPAGSKLTFRDKYLNTQREITDTFSYTFSVSSTDTMSGGKNRFQIGVADKATSLEGSFVNTVPAMQLMPNPATESVKVSFKGMEGEATIRLLSVTGQVVFMTNTTAETGSVIIPLHNLQPGIYITELQTDNARFAERLVKK